MICFLRKSILRNQKIIFSSVNFVGNWVTET
nr:MAG TPA: hypothetical protein [Caudoviricetes sp.]